MAANALIQARIDADVRDRATAVLEEQGMTVSEAVRILLTRTANEGALPFTPANNEAYNAWFRAKVQEALDDPRSGIPNDVMKREWAKKRTELLERARIARSANRAA